MEHDAHIVPVGLCLDVLDQLVGAGHRDRSENQARTRPSCEPFSSRTSSRPGRQPRPWSRGTSSPAGRRSGSGEYRSQCGQLMPRMPLLPVALAVCSGKDKPAGIDEAGGARADQFQLAAQRRPVGIFVQHFALVTVEPLEAGEQRCRNRRRGRAQAAACCEHAYRSGPAMTNSPLASMVLSALNFDATSLVDPIQRCDRSRLRSHHPGGSAAPDPS